MKWVIIILFVYNIIDDPTNSLRTAFFFIKLKNFYYSTKIIDNNGVISFFIFNAHNFYIGHQLVLKILMDFNPLHFLYMPSIVVYNVYIF